MMQFHGIWGEFHYYEIHLKQLSSPSLDNGAIKLCTDADLKSK